jgi:nucleotide-binding universal stress UspA family protein
MLALRRLLVPYDRGPCTAAALGYAFPLAERFGAEVHLVHVETPAAALDDDPAVTLEEPPPSLALVRTTVDAEDVVGGLLRYVAGRDVDLVVMGTHGRHGLAHVFLGSVAERVVREAPCPVLTVHAGAEAGAPGRLRRLLVPLDFSERAEAALRHAAALADAFDARVDLLHAVDPHVVPDTYGLGLLWAEALPDLVGRSEGALRRVAERLLGPGRLGEVLVVVDAPAGAILDAAERLGTDLVVMATHGQTGLKRFALGSVAERVTRYAACPVFTVKSFGKSLVPEAGVPAAPPAQP